MLLRVAVAMLALAEAPLLASADVVDGAESAAGHDDEAADGFTLKAVLHCGADDLVQRVCALRAARVGGRRPVGARALAPPVDTVTEGEAPPRRASSLKPLALHVD